MILSKKQKTENLQDITIKKKSDLIQVLESFKYKKLCKIDLLDSLNLNEFRFDKFSDENKKNSQQNLINYIIKICLTQTNTIISVTDVFGNKIITLSSGSVGLTKRQKKQQPLAILQILKILLLKCKFLQNKIVILEFTNIKSKIEFLIIKMLKNLVFVKSIRSYNLRPHNGCRPKKLKRFKRRTKRKVLN